MYDKDKYIEFLEERIREMMNECGVSEYRTDGGADKLLWCRFIIDSRVDVERLIEKMMPLGDVEFVSDWRL